MTKCYSFYSYKGGSGRTTTALNTINHLIKEMGASPKKPILVVDADLESAGLTFFFGLRDRISGELDAAMNTTRLLSSAEEEDREAAFGDGCDRVGKLSNDVLLEIEKSMPDDRYVFEEMKISFEEKSMLLSLMENYNVYKSLGPKFGKKDVAERIIRSFPPTTLVKRLRKVHDDPALSAEEKITQKRKVLKDFLPLSTFADVSEFYNCEYGTVKFLGVDVHSDNTQALRNKAAEAIDGLIDTCSKKNYSAVIFDCGAGTQSSAHVLHSSSDVVVYCMRPTMQFSLGTESNLLKYKNVLKTSMTLHEKNDGQKPVIILPTAVPKHAISNPLCAESFTALDRITKSDILSEIIDSTFCTPEDSLGEVELFKWREMILGIQPTEASVSQLSEETKNELAKYQDPSGDLMPKDAFNAYEIYAKLAKKLIENS